MKENFYNYLDLFSGIGGFALGASMAKMKFKNHLFSEIEKYCIDLYQLRFPDSIYAGDILKIDGNELKEKYGNDWIISGGFPCQDISIAGKGKGLFNENGEITRSGLWFEYWRLIRDLQPRFAIMENVPAITFRGLDRVLGSLAEIGYNAEWQIISASQIGLPHKRERTWIIAYPESIGCNEKQNELEMEKYDKSIKKKSRYWTEFQFFTYGNNQFVFSEKVKSYICRKNYVISEIVDRLKGLGNSIVPKIAEYLFLLIKRYL